MALLYVFAEPIDFHAKIVLSDASGETSTWTCTHVHNSKESAMECGHTATKDALLGKLDRFEWGLNAGE